MTKIYQLKTRPNKEALGVETYLAPPPPLQGKIIGLDCHPDTFTAAVFVGQTPHEARKVGGRENLGLQALLGWAAKEFGAQDLFVLEAGSNSFELCTRLHALGLRAVVLESCHVGKHAKTYADNDKMAAARIALVFLAGNAPCVWVPDERSRQRRELLHAYGKAVEDHTAAGNSLRAYLNVNAIRPAKGNLELESTRQWILKQRDWSPLQSEILAEHFGDLDVCKERRKRLYRLIAAQMSAEPLMLRSMKVLGVGLINAFALLAVIGDVRRFQRPEKLVAYNQRDKRVKGIEPSCPAWEAGVLPLNYTRVKTSPTTEPAGGYWHSRSRRRPSSLSLCSTTSCRLSIRQPGCRSRHRGQRRKASPTDQRKYCSKSLLFPS